jgi:hypothetical protein
LITFICTTKNLSTIWLNFRANHSKNKLRFFKLKLSDLLYLKSDWTRNESLLVFRGKLLLNEPRGGKNVAPLPSIFPKKKEKKKKHQKSYFCSKTKRKVGFYLTQRFNIFFFQHIIPMLYFFSFSPYYFLHI